MLVAGLPANKCKAAHDRSIVPLTNCVVFGNTVENNAISEVLRRLVAFHAVVHVEAAAAIPSNAKSAPSNLDCFNPDLASLQLRSSSSTGNHQILDEDVDPFLSHP